VDEEVVMPGGQRHAPKPGQPRIGAPVDEGSVADVIGPVIAAAGMDLESVRVSAAGRRRLLRVVVDSDRGVSLDDAAAISRKLSAALDAAPVMGDFPYTLEVSSPGVDRPLTEPRHWRRARGRLVAVALAGARDGAVSVSQTGRAGGPGAAQQVTARVVAATETGVTLDVDGRYREFSYSQLGPGRVQVEFGAPAAGTDAGGPATAAAAPRDVGSADGH
jgi:ribosome maturation factor RimP